MRWLRDYLAGITGMEVVLWALLLLLLFLAPGAFSAVGEIHPDGTAVIYLSAEEMRQCTEQGGCMVVTSEGLAEHVKKSCGTAI